MTAPDRRGRRSRRLAPLLALLVLTAPAAATDYLLYYLGGQSNMDGYGIVKDLPDELKQGVPGVFIFHGNMTMDGTPVDSVDELSAAKAAAVEAGKERVGVVVFRGTERLELEMAAGQMGVNLSGG